MRKRNATPIENHILVDVNELQILTGLGKQSSERLGAEADAIVRIGRRKLYNVKRIEEYVDSITGEKK